MVAKSDLGEVMLCYARHNNHMTSHPLGTFAACVGLCQSE